VGPVLGGDRAAGEPRGSPGRVTGAPIGEAFVSAEFIWLLDLAGELGAGGADVDGGANGPPDPASRPRIGTDPLRLKKCAARRLLRGEHI